MGIIKVKASKSKSKKSKSSKSSKSTKEEKKNREGLPKELKEQIARDIEKHPQGLKRFVGCDSQAYSKFCNNNTTACGVKGDPIRRQIANLIYKWTLLPREEYLSKVVNYYSVDTYENLSARKREQQREENKQANVEPETVKSSFNNNPVTADSPPSQTSVPASTATIVPEDDSSTMTNVLGKKIVFPLPRGLTFVILWVDSKLSNLEVFIRKDGYAVQMKKKIPNPKNATTLLSHYKSWAEDTENKVVSTLDDLLDKLRPKDSDEDDEDEEQEPKEKWTEPEVVISLEEQIITDFVDHKGIPTNHIGYNTDQAGRQIITFFVKTVKAHEKKPAKTKGLFRNEVSSAGGYSEEHESDSYMFDEETVVDDAKAAYDEKISQLNEQLANQQQQMVEQQEQMAKQWAQQQEAQLKQLQQQQQAQQRREEAQQRQMQQQFERQQALQAKQMEAQQQQLMNMMSMLVGGMNNMGLQPGLAQAAAAAAPVQQATVAATPVQPLKPAPMQNPAPPTSSPPQPSVQASSSAAANPMALPVPVVAAPAASPPKKKSAPGSEKESRRQQFKGMPGIANAKEARESGMNSRRNKGREERLKMKRMAVATQEVNMDKVVQEMKETISDGQAILNDTQLHGPHSFGEDSDEADAAEGLVGMLGFAPR